MFRRFIGARVSSQVGMAVLGFMLGGSTIVFAASSGVVKIDAFNLADGTDPSHLASVDSTGNVAVRVSNFPAAQQITGTVKTDRGAPVQIQQFYSGSAGGAFTDVYTVPAGKRLEIEYFNIFATYLITEDKPFIELHTTAGGVQIGWFLDYSSPTGSTGTHTGLAGAASIHAFADAGTVVRLFVNADSGGAGGGVNLAGRLFDSP